MPVKWLLYLQPNAEITVNTQILTEISQCIESSINGIKGGRSKAILVFYKPITRDQTSQNGYPRDLMGVSLPEQPNKYYFVIRTNKIVLEADSNIQSIMEKAQSYKARAALMFEVWFSCFSLPKLHSK
ncbi:hypothetical protein MKW98_027651 [Papaver atlanticum]|uniref:Mediator of RNA polymerase II transcription subunit 20 n=1 Tax=Papaver atlanticum TaxID=357466 RepID=A0AAD4SUR2_9MAGN|nr:hypothetical protein MKW98_027651 [Papaver atlanticum]